MFRPFPSGRGTRFPQAFPLFYPIERRKVNDRPGSFFYPCLEAGGELDDLMQSSGSLELPSDSLQQEASIRQGCSYFAHLLHRAESESCDLDTVIQAYNYGSGFIDYVAEHGGKYTLELSEKFAQQQSGGATVPYDNPIAVKRNDGWRYAYGNMFYAKLVNQHLVR